MLVPVKWSRDYVNIDMDTGEFADKMTMTGTKVETVEFLGKEISNVVVGKIEKITQHPNADKLLVSQIDVGEETPRQIVSGIADVYSPEEFVGKKVIVVTNLKPAKLRGVESQGMVLAGGDKKVLGVVDAGELPVGTTIR